MADLNTKISTQRDRITELLSRSVPEIPDVSRALIRASTGLTTYGQELNAIKASRLKEQKTLFDVLAGQKRMAQTDRRLDQEDARMEETTLRNLEREREARRAGARADRRLDLQERGFDLNKTKYAEDSARADRRLDLAEKEFDFKRSKFKAGQASADRKAFEDAFEEWSKGLAKRDMARLYTYAKDHPDILTAKNAHQVLADGVRDLGLRVPGTSGSKSFKKVQDPESPTGWSWESGRGERLEGAPAPRSETVEIDPKTGTVKITRGQAGKRAVQATERVEAADANLGELERVVGMLNAEDGESAVGASGVFYEKVGGLIEQALGLLGAEGMEQKMAVKNFKVQQIQTSLQSLFGRYLPAILNEENSRYSDKDRQLAQAALPAGKVGASISQIRAALNTIRAVEIRARAREKMKLDGLPDLTYSENAADYMISLIEGGMTPEDAISQTAELRRKYGVANLYGDEIGG